jgi:hypothetical protein
VEVLPLRRDAVSGPGRRIFMAESAVPDFGGAQAVAAVTGVEILPRYQVRVAPQAQR